tara:strand:- start:501 stop:626 length:126 start_codon:yes stop_codon:yes gene_type:complete
MDWTSSSKDPNGTMQRLANLILQAQYKKKKKEQNKDKKKDK